MRSVWTLPFAIAVMLAITDHDVARAVPVNPQPLSAAAPASDVQLARAVAARGPRGGVAVSGPRGGVAVRGPRGGVAVRGPYRVGGRYHGGIWYGTGRHYYGGRWWPYGVGSCWQMIQSGTFGSAGSAGSPSSFSLPLSTISFSAAYYYGSNNWWCHPSPRSPHHPAPRPSRASGGYLFALAIGLDICAASAKGRR